MNSNNVSEPGTLSQRCASSLRANGKLLSVILADFPKSKLEAIDQLLAGGGSVGIETVIDRNATNWIRVVGIEREGARLVLATVTQAAVSQGSH